MAYRWYLSCENLGGSMERNLGGRMTSLVAQMVKRLPTMRETQVQSLSREDPLKEVAAHSSTLAWKIPWMEEPGRLQFMGSQRAGWVTSLTHGEKREEVQVMNSGTLQHSFRRHREEVELAKEIEKNQPKRKRETRWMCYPENQDRKCFLERWEASATVSNALDWESWGLRNDHKI